MILIFDLDQIFGDLLQLWLKPPVDLDLGCFAILPGQYIATVGAHQLTELPELSQQELFSEENGHPVNRTPYLRLDSLLWLAAEATAAACMAAAAMAAACACPARECWPVELAAAAAAMATLPAAIACSQPVVVAAIASVDGIL